MKKNVIALLAPVFLLASCAANSTGITRAEARAAIMDSLEDFASSSDEILKSFTAKYRSVDEEGNTLVRLLGADENGSYALVDRQYDEKGELAEYHYVLGLFEESEEGEESFSLIVSDEDEFVESEDEEIIEQSKADFTSAQTAFVATINSCFNNARDTLDAITAYEEEVDGQYEDEDHEVEEGDKYLDLRGEFYEETAASLSLGVSYAFGEVESIDEEDGEPVYVLSEEGLEEKKLAITLTKHDEEYLLSQFKLDEDTHIEIEYEFTFANPLAEEE